jgi:hypothetical protein
MPYKGLNLTLLYALFLALYCMSPVFSPNENLGPSNLDAVRFKQPLLS